VKNILNFKKTNWLYVILGFVLGLVLVLGLRAATYKLPEAVHYHANYAVYINGQREEFKAASYYEETAAQVCSIKATAESTPMARVHMHGDVNNVVHVEDKLVTWGNLFNVLGWNIGKDYVATRDAIYQANSANAVTYMLNNKKLDNIANTIIGDQDKLLVNFGSQTPDVIATEYANIQNNALKADESKDPAACGSHVKALTIRERMNHMF
jgi:hypothetical protein